MEEGKINLFRNTDRSFSIAVDECDGTTIEGIMFHGSSSYGIHFSSLMEMVLDMDRIYDESRCSKQTFQMRCFPGVEVPAAALRFCQDVRRPGKLMTLDVYVRYRYHAGWQGTVVWNEGNLTEIFKSELQLLQLIDGILNGHFPEKRKVDFFDSCQVSIDSYEFGRITGMYQNHTLGIIQGFDSPVDLAGTLGLFMKKREPEKKKSDLGSNRLKSEEDWISGRKGSPKGTFSIKILFREYRNWQGIIYWQEGKVQQTFRSYKEMLYIMVSALETI